MDDLSDALPMETKPFSRFKGYELAAEECFICGQEFKTVVLTLSTKDALWVRCRGNCKGYTWGTKKK